MVEELMIVLDTETAPMDNTIEEVNAHNMLVYDIGWAIVDKNGKVYETQSFVNADVFLDEKEIMNNAFYSDKIPTYWKEIKQGKRTLTSFYNIRKALAKDCELYNIKEIYCHNAFFDYVSLNVSQRWLTKSKYRYFFPYGVTICDTLKMARQTFGKMEEYKDFCHNNGYITKNNRIRLTAEILYRFITNNLEFEEEHTGLADVMIEKCILAECLKINENIERNLFKEKENNFQTKFI